VPDRSVIVGAGALVELQAPRELLLGGDRRLIVSNDGDR
jgi:hypothetical protein